MISTAVLLLGECIERPETRQSKLEVIATDLTGAQIPDVEVELTPLSNGGSIVKTNWRGARVLYGEYQLRVYARGFAHARRGIRIYQPETVVRIELQVGSIGCPPPPAEIGGLVKHDNRGELWVKAVAVRGIDGGEARVSGSGYFLISGLEYSTYVVMVMQGESVLHEQVVKTYPIGSSSSKLEIELTAKR